MTLNQSIKLSLEQENRSHHEESSCPTLKIGTSVKKGIWLTRPELKHCEAGQAGLVHYFDGDHVLMLPYTHELVIGSTGTGKSEVFYKNQLDLLTELPEDLRPSFLFTDTKGSVHPYAVPKLEAAGYEVIVLDMRNPYQSARYNFILQIYDDYKESKQLSSLLAEDKITSVFDGTKYPSKKAAINVAKAKKVRLFENVERSIDELAHVIIPDGEAKDRTWIEGARNMLRAIVWTMLYDSDLPDTKMTREFFTIANVARIAFTTGDDCEEIIDWLSRAKSILCVQSAINSNYNLRAKITRDGYVSTLNTNLGEFSSSAIGAITATTDEINLKRIAKGKHPVAIFVVTDERQKTTNSICTIFINNLINELVNEADRSDTHSLDRDFVILADEFANMPAIPNLANKITTLRSRRIWMVMAIQSIQQLDMVYGENISSILQDNCDTHLFLGCNNDKTKESFCISMGKRIGVQTAANIDNLGRVSITKSTVDVPVIRKSDLNALELGEFYVKTRTSGNFKSFIKPYFTRTDVPAPIMQENMEFHDYDPTEHLYDIIEVLENEKPPREKYAWDY